MKVILFISFLFLVLSIPGTAVFAQNGDLTDSVVPLLTPIADFTQKLGSIDVDSNGDMLLNNVSQVGGEFLENQIQKSWILDIWNRVNNWMMQNIGISFSEVIKTISDFVIWMLELIIKLIRAGVSLLPL